METGAVDDVENVPHFMGINSHRKPLSRAVESMGFAMVYFELEPGETFSGGLHTHHDQEELFYVLEGTATFETKAGPGAEPETHAVGPGEFVHFERGGLYQSGGNRSDEPVVALAVGVGTPRHGWAETEVLFDCATCGEETVHDVVADDPDDERMPDPEEMTLVCTECGTVIEVE
ncbi:cupin domain-containing protein [Natronomonas sp.]|uniref:cupin domain-containing protein n=1 Tax=Natronomonas sp. TaxID=2184060 RepID=UPI002FC30901